MDQKAIEADVKNYKIREGPLYKRSKFLKEWRERWIVLTTNYLYTFTSKNLDEVTDVLDLKEFKSYKSYLRKDQEMIPPGFKIRTADDMYYFCAKNCNEKWSWLVTLQRLMDYKYVGTSNYNNADWIKTRGFESQIEFETGKSKSGSTTTGPQIEKSKSSQDSKKQVNQEADSILKQLELQQKQLERMKQQLQQKQANLQKKQANFVLQQKKIEEEKVKLQQQSPAKQEKPQPSPEKQQPPAKQEKPQAEKIKPAPIVAEKVQPIIEKSKTSDHQPSVSELRSIFENKKSESTSSKPVPKMEEKKAPKKEDEIHLHRSKIVNSLFEQFKSEYAFSNVLKYVTQFLINVGADEKCGYSSFVVIEGKTNHNKNSFAEVFTEFFINFEDYEKCQNLMKFYEMCIFQMPGLFSPEQTSRAQAKLKDMFNKIDKEEKLALILKNMFIMQKLKKYNKNDISVRLDKIIKEAKYDQARNWAQKLRDDLDK